MTFAARRWCDLDPARHDFDDAEVVRLVRTIVSTSVGGSLASKSLARGFTPLSLEHTLTQALVEAIGPWTAGYRAARSSGGPISAYCCASHSLLHAKDEDANASVARVVAAVREQRAFLETLADRFASLRARTAEMSIESATEHAVADLIELVLEHTHAEDAWQSTLADVVAWYLDAAGHAPEVVAPVIEAVIDWRFASWTTPAQHVREEAATELGLALAIAETNARSTVSSVDALAAWRGVRDSVLGVPAYDTGVPITWDAHLRFIDGRETARDPERARRMHVALASSRASASRNAPLTFALLEKWQALVLGEGVSFREGDAFAKQGRERYPLDAGTRRRFEHWLEQADDTRVPVHVRATRAYFDVCFTHPFDDGNARAARLALDFVLYREGLVLRVVEPLFTVSRAAGDAHGAIAFARSVSAWSGRPT